MANCFQKKLKKGKKEITLRLNLREKNDIKKSHVNDARCISKHPFAEPCSVCYRTKAIRHHNRQTHKANFSKFTMIEFNKPYDKAYGFWHVTTEGDCEGRSITDLGVFEGNIDTIALALADRCYYYTLYFTAVDPTAYDKTPKKDEINISIYGASGMYDMTKEERLDAMRNMLKDRPVFVRDGDRADTFIISTKQESREKRRQKVLDKLTAEERELLGV